MAMEKLNPIRRESSVRVACWTIAKSSRWSTANGRTLLKKESPTNAESQSTMKERAKTRSGKSRIGIIWYRRREPLPEKSAAGRLVFGKGRDSTVTATELPRGKTFSWHVQNESSFLYHAPSAIGIERGHCGCCFGCGFPHVLLEQHPILVDDECHHPRIAVFRGIGNEGESADHLPIDHVVLRTAWRVTALAFEHMKVVAMERRAGVRLCAVSFIGRECRQRPERAFGLTFGRFPVQTVLLACVADELQRELMRASVIVTLVVVLGLSIGQRSAHVDDCQFIPADAARQNLILSCNRVEKPLPASILLQRDRKGKIICSDQQDLGLVGHLPPAVHYRIGCHKCVHGSLILNGIAREDDIFRFRAEDCQKRILIP